MKMRKNKGKIHPSPSSSSPSSSSTPSNHQDAVSVLALLPAAILALISVLSTEDKEVFAYMVTRSMNSVNPSPSPSAAEEKNSKKSKKLLPGSGGSVHRVPVFDCECFDCYTSYWFRWDSSPDKELIHKAIEEFEEFLFSQEQVKSRGKGGRRRERIRREKVREEEREEEVFEESFDLGLVGNEGLETETAPAPAAVEEEVVVVEREEVAAAAEVGGNSNNYNNKGLVRKVLPDVVGLLNSRLWGLWSPNV